MDDVVAAVHAAHKAAVLWRLHRLQVAAPAPSPAAVALAPAGPAEGGGGVGPGQTAVMAGSAPGASGGGGSAAAGASGPLGQAAAFAVQHVDPAVAAILAAAAAAVNPGQVAGQGQGAGAAADATGERTAALAEAAGAAGETGLLEQGWALYVGCALEGHKGEQAQAQAQTQAQATGAAGEGTVTGGPLATSAASGFQLLQGQIGLALALLRRPVVPGGTTHAHGFSAGSGASDTAVGVVSADVSPLASQGLSSAAAPTALHAQGFALADDGEAEAVLLAMASEEGLRPAALAHLQVRDAGRDRDRHRWGRVGTGAGAKGGPCAADVGQALQSTCSLISSSIDASLHCGMHLLLPMPLPN